MNKLLLVSVFFMTNTGMGQDFSSSYSQNNNYEKLESFSPSSLEMVLTINSFPSYLQIGEDYQELPVSKYIPKSISVDGHLENCQFKISTTKYSLSSYTLTKNKGFFLLEDSIIARTTIAPIDKLGAAILSVSTSLKSSITKDMIAPCENLLKNSDKVFIGNFSISESVMLTKLDRRIAKRPLVKHAESVKLFLFWNKIDQQIYLLDDEDFTPMVTSQLFALNPKGDGLHAIRFEPHARFTTGQPQVAKAIKKEDKEEHFGH